MEWIKEEILFFVIAHSPLENLSELIECKWEIPMSDANRKAKECHVKSGVRKLLLNTTDIGTGDVTSNSKRKINQISHSDGMNKNTHRKIFKSTIRYLTASTISWCLLFVCVNGVILWWNTMISSIKFQFFSNFVPFAASFARSREGSRYESLLSVHRPTSWYARANSTASLSSSDAASSGSVTRNNENDGLCSYRGQFRGETDWRTGLSSCGFDNHQSHRQSNSSISTAQGRGLVRA